MARQAERAHMTGLSPIEEMRIAQNELRAKAAKEIFSEQSRFQTSFQRLITTKEVVRKLKNRAKVAAAPSKTEAHDDRLERDMDELTPAEALSFVESVTKDETRMFEKEMEREESKLPLYIISPHGKFRLRWDLLSVLLISYNGIIIPFQIAFGSAIAASVTWIDEFQHFVDAFFLTDIIITFLSAYEDNGRIEHRLNAIAAKYVKSWFAVDLISAFPIYLIQDEYSRIPQLTRLFRLFRLLRLFRMLTIRRILNSCFFYLIGEGKSNGWVATQGISDSGLYEKYVTAFYWSIMTMTTVGYGDIHPCTTSERIFAIVAMIIGAWIFAYGITNVVAMVANLNAAEAMFHLKMDELNDYMEARQLPVQLRFEIREFFFNARMSTETKLSNEGKILTELSALLRSKIAFAINDSVLSKMPFFMGADHNFLMELALSMRMVCFPPMEEVILEGEIGEEMFFIFRGVVEIVKEGVQLGLLGQKQYFGEMAILNQNCLRTATVRTLCFCELRMLTREKFLIALTHFPAMKQRIAKIVDKRTRRKPTAASEPPSVRRVSSSSSLDKIAAALPATMDEKTTREITMPIPKTTLNRISQLNTSFSGSYRNMTAEGDLESIQTKINAMIQQQESLSVLLEDMEDRMREVKQRHAPRPSL
uniref:Cyclic nucleotide-binding domain-containing protein n=1 Tax=Globisporangium ultimum (strain ATCC 200006 / CBS 805.95 / DAOM BR144) TaxID=431595 RepID=K3W9Y3_GLOUD